jgi:4'-phosphopantetheinyl transferase
MAYTPTASAAIAMLAFRVRVKAGTVDMQRPATAMTIDTQAAGPRTARDLVRIWTARIPETPLPPDHLLSADETAHAATLCSPEARRSYVVRRGLLRRVIALHLGADPARIQFRYERLGRPLLLSGPAGFSFSASHSGDLAVVAVSLVRAVGVDIERLGPQSEPLEDLAQQVLTQRELKALEALPADRRAHAFLACWTRKEAYVKGLGEGLGRRLQSIDVGVASRRTVPVLDGNQVARPRSTWETAGFSPGRGYVAAIAAEGTGWRFAVTPLRV